MSNRVIKIFIAYLVASIFVSLFLLLIAYPLHPTTKIGMLVWYLVSAPIWLTLEAVGAVLFSEKISNKINNNTNKLSIGRISYGVIVSLLSLGMMFMIVENTDTSMNSFFENNFSYNR